MGTVYVGHVGPIIVGPPKKRSSADPFLASVQEFKVEPLADFLSGLSKSGRTLLSHGITATNSLLWGGKVFGDNSIRGEEIGKIIAPMIREGKIPDDLDFVKLQQSLGISDRESLELAIFGLLKDIAEQSIAWD